MKVYLHIAFSFLLCLLAAGCISFKQPAHPKITSISHTIKGTIIVVNGKENQKYLLQKTGDLLNGKWKDVGTILTSQSKEVIFVDKDTTDSSQFYRIMLPE